MPIMSFESIMNIGQFVAMLNYLTIPCIIRYLESLVPTHSVLLLMALMVIGKIENAPQISIGAVLTH